MAAAAELRFFKIMMPGFDQQLNLPSSFCNKMKLEYKMEELEHAIINGPLGQSQIEIEVSRSQQAGSGGGLIIWLKNGWQDFFRRHGLKFGYLLLFHHTGNLHFNVAIFDTTTCEKTQFPTAQNPNPNPNPNSLLPKKIILDHMESEKESRAGCPFPCKIHPSFFRLTMYPSHALRKLTVHIPQTFWRCDRMRGKECLMVRDCGGREWRMVVRSEKTRGKIGKGWNEFYEGNDLKEGDVCVFRVTDLKKKKTTTARNRKWNCSSTLSMDVEILREGS
ncbi:B3 domain-containing protein Os01g0723500-like [Andrographis paniculata]|uniref:B3 domain-containing protein Os01g0723500-like n=1 Tax=Andrographis paniculata TaxID=175694 RepID=UPI0021E898BE|nr:B3 domain-containing protein Os01g0723500-like [Andrographis paniculata]